MDELHPDDGLAYPENYQKRRSSSISEAHIEKVSINLTKYLSLTVSKKFQTNSKGNH